MSSAVRSHVDATARTAVITTTFEHPVEVVWQLFADPDRLARWWGPPGMPLTIDRHELHPGGVVDLTVVTTEHGTIRGRWTIHEVDAPHRLAFTFSGDGIGPTEVQVVLDAEPAGTTTMLVTVRFTSDEAVRHALDIGFVEGLARSCTSALQVVGTD